MDSAGGAIRSFTGFPLSFIMSFLHLLLSFLSLPSHAYSLQIVRWVFLLAHVMDRTGWELFSPFKQTPFSFVCMYLCKYRWSYRGVRRSRMGGFFFLIFSLQSCLHFFCHWVGAFSFFIQTGFYGVLHIKHVSFFLSFPYFLFSRFPRQNNIYSISCLFFHPLLFSVGRSDLFHEEEGKGKNGKGEREREIKKKRCDGWTEGEGRAEKSWKCSFFSRRVMNETFVSLSVYGVV
ncbi:hypothetical protein HOY82DRAFT_346290 [Tuber indicum]|nr:hypothetical protein HOY82DRAFT_346290 [Tuber indicum]